MLLRLWQTRFEADRLAELQRFADEVSTPMFASLPGCLGHLYAVADDTWITATFWASRDDIDNAESSQSYQDVVRKISSLGLLRGTPAVEVYEVTGFTSPLDN